MMVIFKEPEAEFKEFEPRLKYGWFHLKLYSMFQDLSLRSIETGFWRIYDAAQIPYIPNTDSVSLEKNTARLTEILKFFSWSV